MLVSPHIKNSYIKKAIYYKDHAGNPFEFPLNLDDSGINAVEEMVLFCDFLANHSTKKSTLDNYTKELEKFSQWLWRIHRKSLIKLTKEDAKEYIEFIQSPPFHWVSRGASHAKFYNGEINPCWRPFTTRGESAYKPTYQSNRASISTLKVFFNFLINKGTTQINPFGLIKNPILRATT